MMKRLAAVLLSGMLALPGTEKPVGVWKGNSATRIEDLIRATALNPQWSADKPVRKNFTGQDFDSCAAVIYLHGKDIPFRFREWKPAQVQAAEKYVENGGLLIILADGAPTPGGKTGIFAKLLGAEKYGTFTGKAEIPASDWKECGEIPQVFEHMLSGKLRMAALSGLTTAKMLIGNRSGALAAENRLGKGRVLFINIRLSQSLTPYRQPYNQTANACLEQLFPFVKKIHAELMTASPELSKEKRERWDYAPLGPKRNPQERKKPVFKPPVSSRKYTKLAGQPLRLVENGQPRAFIVFRPGTRDAAGVLNDLLRKMTGTALPVASPGAVSGGGNCWKGRTWDCRIEFAVKPKIDILAEKGKIVIGAPNPMLGVCSFMREALGYRMLWPGDCGEVYRTAESVEVEPFHLEDAPFFRQRHIRNSLHRRSPGKAKTPGRQEATPGNVPGSAGAKDDFSVFDSPEAAALRKDAGRKWWLVQRLGGTLNSIGGMSFYNWQDRFGKNHPEYMALQFDGTRRQKTKHIRICKANPEVVRQAAADARAILDRNKNAESYCLSPSDSGYDIFCMCPLCRAWDCSDAPQSTGRVFLSRNRPVFRTVSKTDRVFRFTCEVARELKKSHPKIKVRYLAYAGYLAPPNYYFDAPDNLMVTFVGLEYLNDAVRDRDRRFWDFWAGISRELVLRPNFLCGGGTFPLVYVHRMDEDLKYCAATGMVGGDFDSLGHQWATLGLNYYVLAQLLWDPSQNVDAIIDDYCQKGFGPAAEEMKAYFAHLEKLTDKMAARKAENIKALEDPTNDYSETLFQTFTTVFSDREMAELETVLKRAHAKTAPDSPERKRVEFITTGFLFNRDRCSFIRKYAAAKSKTELRQEAADQCRYWYELYMKHPYAVPFPNAAKSQYRNFWRHCGWKTGPALQ